jgi:MscS family membrane protein
LRQRNSEIGIRIPKLLAALLLAFALRGQTPVADVKDPLGRSTPHGAIVQFLEACHSRDYQKASHYLDLRKMPAKAQATAGADLARQLEDLLDDTPFDISALSRNPEGDESNGLSKSFEDLYKFQLEGQTFEMQLERVQLKPGLRVWLVSADSVAMIPKAHRLVAEMPFERKLPQQLVTFEVFDTPVWRWIALLIIGVALWVLGRYVARALVAAVRRLVDAPALEGPLRLILFVAGVQWAMEFASPAVLPRLVVSRVLGLILALSLAWAVTAAVDLVAEHWQQHLDPRVQAMRYSVLPLGRQILKLSLFLFAILTVLSAWGYNTSTILAGLGVGGIAVALAAQKTIENLFGGISVIGDRPVLVGDFCRFGDRMGTIMHIGLRSTRIRTPDRTIITVPNAQFASIALENISGRDKMWFHPMLNLRRDSTSDQLLQVLSSVLEILKQHPQVETGPIPVRFVGVGAYSLDVEVNVYITTADGDEFLALQQELLLQMLQAVEHAGTALAVPIQERFAAQRPAGSNGQSA